MAPICGRPTLLIYSSEIIIIIYLVDHELRILFIQNQWKENQKKSNENR